jgi:ferredoxin
MNEPSQPGMSARVSHERCVGIGMCVLSCPGGFEFDDAGLSVFQPAGTWTSAELLEAADSCPTSAIDVLSNGGKLP